MNTTDQGRDLSFALVRNANPKLLAPTQIEEYNERGYLKPFRVFNEAEAKANREYFDWLFAEVSKTGGAEGAAYSIHGYHTRCAGLWDVVTHPKILDYVEDLIGPNFVCWGTHYFAKQPHDPKAVPFHQDASYWPFQPARTVTAWLAIDDADRDNSAMMFIPGTHRMGHLPWKQAANQFAMVLNQEIENFGTLGEPVYDELKAGEMSLHADMLAHGSEPNPSARRRCGLTLRYCPVEVSAGDSGWNNDAILCRGEDHTGHWNLNPRPDGEYVDPASWTKTVTAIASG